MSNHNGKVTEAMSEPTRSFSAKLPHRELVIAAYTAGMLGCTKAEITKYAILRLIGHEHESAKALATSSRTTVDALSDTEEITTVRLPVEWIEAAQEKVPNANASTVYRFALTRLTMPEDQALAESRRAMGPKPGSKRIVSESA